MKNAWIVIAAISMLLINCRKPEEFQPVEPAYYYTALFEYMLDAGTHSTKVYGVVSRDTMPNRGLEWVPPTDAFKVNGAALNSSNGEYNWQESAYVDGNVIFDGPGTSQFDHFFNAADSLFNRLPAGTDTIHLTNYLIDIGSDSILPDEYLILFITQGTSSGKVYFNYDQASGAYRSGLSQGDDLVIGPATVQLSRRRHSDPTSIVGGTTVHCVYECRSEFVNVIIYP
jgi:hypothetical protein